MVRHNYEAWQQSTSSYRRMNVRNLIVSEKKKFPDALFHQKMAPASLLPLNFVGIVVKGQTAAATYFGKTDWDIGGTPVDAALVLLFTKERGEWKYDQARNFNLSKLPTVKERFKKGDASVLLEQDGFQPLGVIPPAPKACPKPKYIAKIFADCPGRQVSIDINGISHHVFDNEASAQIISGGLKDGGNSIAINANLKKGSQDKGPAFIGVFIMPETEGNVPGTPYNYTIGDADKDGVYESAIFNVTPEVLKRMNPEYLKEAKARDAQTQQTGN